ncbi:MAG: GNAT family N-acetyltransferase [Oscillospiraceae bacterium]|nr:GNAT family N-acetyltransferase [Oscillospiraceae bacterium]
MDLVPAEFNQIENIVGMSVQAFETDIEVGGKEGDVPPEYDSVSWHRQMAEEGHLFQAMIGEKIVGAAILFEDEKNQSLYIGRIFIDKLYHKKGFGMQLMEAIEKQFSYIREINLDTPCWNVRTNAFYQKLGYELIGTEDGFALYQKIR